MTTPNLEHLARGWALIAEGAQYLSMAYASIESPAARAGVGSAAEGAKAPQLSSAPVPSFDELPPEGFETAHGFVPDEPPALKPQVDAGLGKCPVHGLTWKPMPAGVSKAGKPYKAFWKCSEKDGDLWCNEKPQKIWADTHPAERAA